MADTGYPAADELARNLLLTIAFDGRGFHGWQVQENAVTVQGVLQAALAEVLGVRPDVKGCSRTDSGVHARMFCVGMRTASSIPCGGLVRALNTKLPDTIAAIDCREVPEDFHARYSVREKQYTYEIYNSPVRSPFLAGRVWRLPFPISAEQMETEGQALVGRRDFTSFCASGSRPNPRPCFLHSEEGSEGDKRNADQGDICGESHVRTVSELSVRRSGDVVTMSITADGFLYNMVRIIAGTLCDMQRGTIPPGSLPQILAAKDRRKAGITAPPEGLYLNRVIYEKL